MTARAKDITTVYIAAVGGQGGALLTDWLLAAANQMRYQAHSVGIPGMSQRGGATSYYVEMAPEETAPGLDDALLSPAPFLGEVDCLIGLEFLELGRAVQSGYSSEKTVVVGSTHRDYTILEKMPSYDEPYDEANIKALVERLSRRQIVFDARALAKAEGLAERHVNAILLGAVAATGALPFREEAYRLAIKAVGVATDLNFRAFEAGLGYALAGLPAMPRQEGPTPGGVGETLTASQRAVHRSLMEKIPTGLNGELRSILDVAFARLIDYQNGTYARGYLDNVLALWERDQDPKGGFQLTRIYAQHLANLMSYEDPIRVAALKSDPRRFKHIETQHGVREGQTYRLGECFQPEIEELYGLLPAKLIHLLRPSKEESADTGRATSRRTLPVTIKTTSLLGMAILKGLAALKGLRPQSWRRRKEEAFQEIYTGHVTSLLSKSYELACLTAQAGGLIRGYGAVRRRTERLFHTYMDEFLCPLVALEERFGSGGGYTLALRAAAAVQGSLKPTGTGFGGALSLALTLQARAEDCSYDELLEMVASLSV
jgi:indolepyruvate ferredoxin oxidoreductase beta subunit